MRHEMALLCYRSKRLVGIALHGSTGLGRTAEEWRDRGDTVVVTTREDALTTWHTTLNTANPYWNQNLNGADARVSQHPGHSAPGTGVPAPDQRKAGGEA